MYYSFSFYRWSVDWKKRIKNLEFVSDEIKIKIRFDEVSF